MSDQPVFSKSFLWIGISLSLMILSFMAILFIYENPRDTTVAVVKDPVLTCNVSYPEPKDHANDFTSLLTKDQVNILDTIIGHHEKETGNRIAIVILDSTMLQGCNLNTYTYGLAKKWGIWQKDKSNGIVLSICIQLREMSIQKGPGMEKILSVEATNDILQNIMAPEFKEGNYFEGIREGLEGIIKAVGSSQNKNTVKKVYINGK